MTFTMGDNPRILLISSANPLVGPGAIGMDIYDAFKRQGLAIDFLTLYKVESMPGIRYVYKKPAKWHDVCFKIRRKCAAKPTGNHYFFYG